MSQLIVIAFDKLDDARGALRGLRDVEAAGGVKFEDTAIVERDSGGKVHVKNEVSGATETGAAIGAVIGGLVFVLFPIAGIALGAAAGAAIGSSLGTGVEGEFVEDVKRELAPGKSALFLVVKEQHADATVAALRKYQGEVLQTTLSAEAEESLRLALK